jgi:hypothetical protein
VKQLLLKVLAAFGMVPARRYNELARQAAELRGSAKSWKIKATEASERAKALDGELHRQTRLVKEARDAANKSSNDGDIVKLRQQLADTERELILAREHLMAIEVKLDILEGAANVLDVRTRTAIRQSTGTGAAV